MNIILPCTMLSVLVMVSFCLPPDSGEKISLGISVLLAFTVFLLTVAESIPRTSLHTPIMGRLSNIGVGRELLGIEAPLLCGGENNAMV